ncbi:chemoreceptor glutamine deamidase CheD [Nitrosomonas sp.]|uniref:chemoreceptor glutamine deamidase CheD n=1 Tax=Nitrosomonas sp. TaxID=42353 RepID=UPI00260958CF|nr:chemoreceptor glutamine deamidase CheD [Nitrosomonas sp.]MBE7528051.1 chemoreceptor glutamine deamidase CheD [Burkholderiales bacterium]
MINPQIASNFYFDQRLNMEAVKLLPGEFFVTTRDMVLSTVLGSCVSACIFDNQSGVGGMNHFMLPKGEDDQGIQKECARFGGYAMDILIRELLRNGARKENLAAKVFGGGNVQRAMVSSAIGSQNAKFVKKYLAERGIPILAADLEGECPRKIHFFTKNGRVLQKKLYVSRNDTIVEREQNYSRLLLSAAQPEIQLSSCEN